MRAPQPGFLQVEPVGRCKLHCRMCPVHLRPGSGTAQMPFDEVLRLLDGFPSVRELGLF